ncbi:hypothetical protein AAG906_020287 [Vitis piasezkii]
MLSTHFDMKDLVETSYVLGIKILCDRANGVLKLSQRTYIEKILKRFNMHNYSFARVPIVKGDRFSKARCPQNDDEREKMRTIPYSSLVGNLMYAQVCTRLDIAFVVGMLGRYLSNPGSQHWKAAKKVLRYLQGTKDLMLTYQRTNILDVVGFCDADFAGCIDDKKSTTGYIFVMARGVVSWKSVKQTLTTSSTMEAEYVACYEACCHAIWMRNFILALGVVDSISKPLKLFCDNSAVVAFSKNTMSTSRSKHIDVKFYFVKEKMAESLIDIEHMCTKVMLVDPLTKGLGFSEGSLSTYHLLLSASCLNSFAFESISFILFLEPKQWGCFSSMASEFFPSSERIKRHPWKVKIVKLIWSGVLMGQGFHLSWTVATRSCNSILQRCWLSKYIQINPMLLSGTHLHTFSSYAGKSKLSINKGPSTSCHASAKLDTAQQTTDQLGYLYLEYMNPGLMSLKSIDLSPYSWVAVAWYVL